MGTSSRWAHKRLPVQQHTELEDGDTNDLGDSRVGHGLVLVHMRDALLDVGRGLLADLAVDGFGGVLSVATLGAVRKVRTGGEGVPVGVVSAADLGEDGGAGAEGYKLDDEDQEDAAEADRHGVGLWGSTSVGGRAGGRRRRYARNCATRIPGRRR